MIHMSGSTSSFTKGRFKFSDGSRSYLLTYHHHQPRSEMSSSGPSTEESSLSSLALQILGAGDLSCEGTIQSDNKEIVVVIPWSKRYVTAVPVTTLVAATDLDAPNGVRTKYLVRSCPCSGSETSRELGMTRRLTLAMLRVRCRTARGAGPACFSGKVSCSR